MAWRKEKLDKDTIDLVWDAVERGIAQAPTRGTANLQNVNISTEEGEAMVSFGRLAQQQEDIQGGTLTPDGDTLLAAATNLYAGAWIQVTASTISGITASSGSTTASVDYLLVGGGGGGGGALSFSAGGGGGGQVIETNGSVSVQNYTITIGDGGNGAFGGGQGDDGQSSSFDSVATAIGGGGGGDGNGSFNGRTGASGGGGGSDGSTAGTGGTGTAGNNGGAARSAATLSGGGGGGAGGVGQAGQASTGGAGGTGSSSSITGTSKFYGAGGGGGRVSSGGAGGSSVGGAGGSSSGGSNAVVNTGSGGGGAGGNNVSGTYDGGSGSSGVFVISYTTGDMYATGGTITRAAGKTIHIFTESGTLQVLYINSGGYYYVDFRNTSDKIKLSEKFDPAGAHPITHGTSGTATYNVAATVGQGVEKAFEKYSTATDTEYRYYVLDSGGYVWVYDTGVYAASLAASGVGTLWMLTDHIDYSLLRMTGLGAINGWLLAVSTTTVYGKPTTDLGRSFVSLPGAVLNNPFPTHGNFAYVGHQGKMFYCDSNYIGEIFPTTSLETSIANIQSFSQYSASSTVGTISALLSGSIPYSPSSTSINIPAVFFSDEYGTTPSALTEGTVYYINYAPDTQTFEVFTSIGVTSGALDISTGATGNQFFNTFYPLGTHSSATGDHPLVQLTPQRLNLPTFEIAQCMVEVGNSVIIGCQGNTMYPWNQIDAAPSDIISLPEADVKTMINVNNAAYVFAGNKGNVYITNNSVASLVTKVPDYVAGVPGTPSTYIEPYFVWGDAMYLRGRIYFSILDQTADKAGNCGGVWSFVPTQNFSMDHDMGLSMRLENQQSYGDYSGYATLLMPMADQLATAPRYWSFWQDSYSAATSDFGIDFTSTVPTAVGVIETDLLETGTLLNKKTFSQIEYKLSTQLAAGDSVQLYYRTNSTDAWASCGTTIEEAANRISGYYSVNFQKTQWTQIRAELTSNNSATTSFVRFKEIRLR